MKYILLLIFSLATLGCSGNGPQENNPSSSQSTLSEVKAYVLSKDKTLETLEGVELAIALRELTYRSVPLGRTPQDYEFSGDYLKEVVDSFESGPNQIPHICGGISRLYGIVAAAFGFPVRYVGAYNGVDTTATGYNNHATTEVLIEGKWIVMDATFNVAITDADGNYISYIESKSGYQIERGYQAPGRYYTSQYHDEYTSAIYVGPSPFSQEEVYPSDWDATVKTTNGQRDIGTWSHKFWLNLNNSMEF